MNDQALYEHYVNGQGAVLLKQFSMKFSMDLLKDTEIRYNLPFKRLAWNGKNDHILLVGGSAYANDSSNDSFDEWFGTKFWP